MVNLKCQFCGAEATTTKSLLKHVFYKHSMKSKKYYDSFIKKKGEGICHRKSCKKVTTYKGYTRGYRTFCSYSCRTLVQWIMEK